MTINTDFNETVTPWSRVLEQLVDTKLFDKFSIFMELRWLLSFTYETAIAPYPEPDKSSSHPQTLFF